MNTDKLRKKEYLVLECNACNRYLLAVSTNKTRTCPYCNKRVALENVKVVSRSATAEQARVVLQKLKMQNQAESSVTGPRR